MWAILNTFGWGRFLAWVGKATGTAAVLDWTMDKAGVAAGYASGLSYWLFPGLWEKAYKELSNEIKAAAEIASGPAAAIVRGMTDMPIHADMLAKIASGGLSAEDRSKLGDWFVDIFDQVFKEDPIATGYLNRDPGTAERLAFREFVGRNAQLQLGGAMIDILKDRLPEGLTLGLGDLVDRMEKIMGFSDSQEEIMEPLMEKIIISGLEKRYNRLTLPTDLTPNDAIGMFIRGWIDRETMDKILANEGVRQDIRQNLINLQAKDLTESDVQDLYNWGDVTLGQVEQYYRNLGFLAPDATNKANLVAADRLRKLIKEQEGVIESQAVKGLIPDSEYEGFLRNNAYKGDEVNVLMDILRRKKTMSAEVKAKRITGSFNITPERVKEGNSAIIKWNIRNADSITITGLGSVGPRGEEPLLVTRSQTYTLHATNDAGEAEDFFAYVEVRGQPEVRLPRVNLSLTPRAGQIGSVRELRWDVTGATAISLDGSPVPPQGVIFPTPILPTFYTLTASNLAGSISTQDVALVDLPEDFIDPAVKPSVSFSVSPLVVTPGQPQVEIKWGTQNSDSQTLTYPDGRTISVDSHGALVETISASGVFTFRARNDRGETHRQEAVIFNAPPAEA